jgi:hypothetical protein
MAGNPSEKTTLRGFPDQIESLYGNARRVGLRDRGIPAAALLREMRTLPRKLRALRRSGSKRDPLRMRVAAAKTDVGRACGFVNINLPRADREGTRDTFACRLDQAERKEAELRDGR